MILILNDTTHCRENETSAAASPFECPREFIKSTDFSPPLSNSDPRSCTSQEEYSRTKIFTAEHNVISVSLFSLTHYDKETSQIFRMAFYHAAATGKVIKRDENRDCSFSVVKRSALQSPIEHTHIYSSVFQKGFHS